MTSKIDQNSIKKTIQKMTGFWSEKWQKSDPKMNPKIDQQSILGSTWPPRGAQENPRGLQRPNSDDFWSIWDRILTVFGPIWDRIWTEFGPIWTDSRSLFYPGSRVNANCLSMWFQALPKHFQSESSDPWKRLLTLPLVNHANLEKGIWKIGDLP